MTRSSGAVDLLLDDRGDGVGDGLGGGRVDRGGIVAAAARGDREGDDEDG